MGTTYYVTRSANLFGVYVCSTCGSVNLMHFVLQSSSASTWSQAKAQQVADESIEKFTKALQDFPQKPFLVGMTIKHRTFTTGYEVGLLHTGGRCSFCNHFEIWQRDESYAPACTKDPDTGVHLVSNVPEESKMRVFASLEAANEYAAKLLALKSLEGKQYWLQHTEVAEDVRMRISNLKNNLVGLEERKAASKDKSNLIAAQIEKKKEEIKGYSLFSAEKKTAKAELKDLTQQHQEQLDEDILLGRKIDEEIKFVKDRIQTLYMENPAVMDDLQTFKGRNDYLHDAYRVC